MKAGGREMEENRKWEIENREMGNSIFYSTLKGLFRKDCNQTTNDL